MARFVSLKAPVGVVLTGVLVCFSTSALRAQSPAAPAVAKPPVKTAATTNAAPVAPLPPPETLNRYGKILTPSDEATHPLKLKLPLAGAGEVKVPTPDELGMREKLEQLAKLSDDEIHRQLAQWPAFSKMTLRDQAMMLMRIQDFRDYRSRTAAQKAHDMGLTLTQDQKTQFEKVYWDKRLAMDHDLVKQFGPIFAARQQKMDDELSREFAAAAPATNAAVKPLANPVQPMTPVPAKTPVTPGGEPVAQGQH
jgi:hypothetical protein